MNDILKPCPFCGAKATLQNETNNLKYVNSYIECSKCYAKTNKYKISVMYSSDEKAIEAWNGRVEDEQTN